MGSGKSDCGGVGGWGGGVSGVVGDGGRERGGTQVLINSVRIK